MNIKYDFMLTKELIIMKENLEKRIDKLITDYNGIVDIVNRRIASTEEGCALVSVTEEGEIVNFS